MHYRVSDCECAIQNWQPECLAVVSTTISAYADVRITRKFMNKTRPQEHSMKFKLQHVRAGPEAPDSGAGQPRAGCSTLGWPENRIISGWNTPKQRTCDSDRRAMSRVASHKMRLPHIWCRNWIANVSLLDASVIEGPTPATKGSNHALRHDAIRSRGHCVDPPTSSGPQQWTDFLS